MFVNRNGVPLGATISDRGRLHNRSGAGAARAHVSERAVFDDTSARRRRGASR